MQKYNKAIIAFVALLIAIANARGYEIPDTTGDQLSSTIILLLGTFSVFQVTNKGKNNAQTKN